MFDGFGTYYYANGDKYEGPWRKGEKHGEKGKFSRHDGTTLVVSWKNDRANVSHIWRRELISFICY